MSKQEKQNPEKVVVESEVEKSEVAKREEEMMAFWREREVFNKSVVTPAGGEPKGDFVFYDGPPFATGLPHYGHLLAGTIKDAIPRFWTMNGYRVKRRWGWDCHGLPVENLIEKKLGLANKRDIEDYGVKNFNEFARNSVLEFRNEWKETVPRMGRMVDMDNDYKTMDSSYTESVWWVFKTLYEKGLVYEGFKSMHLCPRCGTTLSNFEVNQGYADIKDIAATVRLPLLDEDGQVTTTSLLVWTTTPWTLPGNLAAAVNRELDYVKVKTATEMGAEEFLVLAKGRLAQLGDLAYEVVEEFKGEVLIGKSYLPPFSHLQSHPEINNNAFKIYHGGFVEVGEEGTGGVHIAPAFGEDDLNLALENNLPVIHHVDYEGRFNDFVTEWAGRLVKPKDDDEAKISHLDSDIEIIKALKASGKLFKKENITHSYPHCWRDKTPLINYATTSWFIKVTDFKDKLVAANSQVKWAPDHVGTNRFGNWLEGARDWAVSRQRYWGAPLPIWRNPKDNSIKVFGSLAELKAHSPKHNNFFLIRHGESESNVSKVNNSDRSVSNPLTLRGQEQVKEAAKILESKQIDLLIYSPFERTKATADILAGALGLSPAQVIVDERITEIGLGDFDGQSNQSYQDFLHKQGKDWSTEDMNGESWQTVMKRVGDFLYDINTRYKNKNILVVSHNAPLQMLEAVTEGVDLTTADFTYDTKGIVFGNAEVREINFVPIPHNDNYTLDYHRPYIDEVQLFAGEEKLVRVPDVFDCWFESGSMPYGQYNYPFANESDFITKHFPAKFIAEGVDQTRGWFYSMIVLGVALFDRSPYENVVVNGMMLAEDGRKMSKSLNNYPDPMDVVNELGADAVRFYLLSSPVVKGEDLNFSKKDILEIQRKNLGRLHNVLAMYEMFKGDGEEARHDSSNVLDKWIVARLFELVADTTAGYQAYELDKAVRPLTDFIDDLSVWYLRRSRERLKGRDEVDKKFALQTLRFVLLELAKVMAPAMPFYAEYLYLALRDESDPESVHLAKWPEGGEIDPVVLGEMSLVREFVTLALEARVKAGIKVRQPLSTLTINIILEEEYAAIVRDEVNVKFVVSSDTTKSERASLDTKITPELKKEGDVREVMRAIQDTRKKLGLNPNDRVVLIVSEALRERMSGFENEVELVCGVTDIKIGSDVSVTLTIGEVNYEFGLVKV